MWLLTIRSPNGPPREHILKPGKTSIGRKAENDIPITDEAASRFHAEVTFDPAGSQVTLTDLGSTNGTFVNQERISQPVVLRPNDQIRIGQHTLDLDQRDTQPRGTSILLDTQPISRSLLLESLDRYAVLLCDVSERLNTLIDLDTALREVSDLMREAMGADKSKVILADSFSRLQELGFPTSIAKKAISQRAAVIIPDMYMSTQTDPTLGKSGLLMHIHSALCVPVMMGDEVIGLIYVYKTSPFGRPFDQRDLQLAVAISHQAALTVQRARLLSRVRREQRIRQLLERFLSPPEAEVLVQDYLQHGRLPELTEQTLTVLFADIRDSTALAERVGPRRFSEILGRYYQSMTDSVFAEGGMMDKYMGDGLMAVFGVPRPLEDAGERAVRAALAMLNQMDAISKDQAEVIEIGIGINTGPAMAGYLGTEERIEFTVLGDTVNVAQRLEGFARPNRVFIGPDTYLSVAGKFNTRPVGNIEVKGRTQPVDTHEVLRA
jgi:adenylate cyclase